VSYGGTATALSVISGSPNQNNGISTIGLPPTLSFIKSGQTFTLQGSINTPGTYNGIITTNSNGGCSEITRTIQIVVTAPDVTNTSTGNTTTSDTSTTSDANTSSGTSTTSVASSSSSYSIDVTATNSSNYTLSGSDRSGNISGNYPDLIFNVGDTIDFVVNASGHPFYLKTIAGTGIRNTVTGLNNNGTTNQTISWTPTSSGTYYYQCSLHGGMVGTITIQ
jgi:plastocyanin